MSIRKLPPQVVHQIAAGEVIERPASVLKELVENSLDAGSKKMRVRFEGGGAARLSVEDDGHGVPSAELPLVFESHATSKLQRLEDFAHLRSMGFRGEAMSSIASVAEVEFSTQHASEKTASKATSLFGRWKGVEKESARLGSRVEVRRLFEKLPVRHKFLKSPVAESRKIHQMFRTYALAHPERHWILEEADKQRLFEFSPSSPLERSLQIFDQETQSENWWEMQSERKGWKLHFVGLKPRYFQKSRKRLHLFLNSRPIEDRSLEFAIFRAFEGYTEQPRSVQGVLWMEGSPERFDVNVHPCKTAVRFIDPDSIFSAIVHSLREALSQQHMVSPHSGQSLSHSKESLGFSLASEESREILRTAAVASPFSSLPSSSVELTESSPVSLWPKRTRFEYIGQLEKTYLLAKWDEKLFVFDQHALHERILYERWMTQWKARGRLQSQRFLFPQKISGPGLEDLLDRESELQALGFELRGSPGAGVLVVAAPAELKESLAEILRQLRESFENATESLFREQIANMACHAAIRAHDRVDPEVARQWFDQFQSEDALGHCPHGRPTFVEMASKDFEKLFHR